MFQAIDALKTESVTSDVLNARLIQVSKPQNTSATEKDDRPSRVAPLQLNPSYLVH